MYKLSENQCFAAMIQMAVVSTDTIPRLIKEQPQPFAFCLKEAVRQFDNELSTFRPVGSKVI